MYTLCSLFAICSFQLFLDRTHGEHWEQIAFSRRAAKGRQHKHMILFDYISRSHQRSGSTAPSVNAAMPDGASSRGEWDDRTALPGTPGHHPGHNPTSSRGDRVALSPDAAGGLPVAELKRQIETVRRLEIGRACRNQAMEAMSNCLARPSALGRCLSRPGSPDRLDWKDPTSRAASRGLLTDLAGTTKAGGMRAKRRP